jgi:hypothetical protein
MEMQLCPILGIISGGDIHPLRSHSCSHDRGVDRDGKVATCSDGEFVSELNTHRCTVMGDYERPEIMECIINAICLPVSTKRGIGQIGMNLLGKLTKLDLVVVRAAISRFIRNSNRDIRPKVVCPTSESMNPTTSLLMSFST